MRKNLLELEKILQLLQKVNNVFDQTGTMEATLVNEILNDIEAVNLEVYGCKEYPGISLHKYTDNPRFFSGQLNKWQNLLSEELQYRKSIINKIDYDFHVLSAHISTSSKESLLEEAVDCLKQFRQNSEMNYKKTKRVYNNYHYFWGSLDLDNGNIDLLKNRIHEIKNHWADFCWLYNNLTDYRSKKVLYGILHYWMTFDCMTKNSIVENNYDDYYDFDIITCNKEEVFVDLGAYNGDSTLSFINNFGVYKRIYCYEMTDSSMEIMKQRLADFDHIVYRQVAVGSMAGTVCINPVNGLSSYTVMSQESNIEEPSHTIQIPMVKLDDDIQEPITFLKMDIEGSELEAMKGAEQHIRNDKPKLAVCSYHNNHHIYEIPQLMKKYNPQYKLYMRYNGPLDNPLTSEYVTFAIDPRDN